MGKFKHFLLPTSYYLHNSENCKLAKQARRVKVLFITMGSLSPPTRCFTAPSFSETLLTVLLSLSATNRQLQGSSEARDRPEGWAKPALWGYALFRFSSFPLPANRRQVPSFNSLKKTNSQVKCQHCYTVPNLIIKQINVNDEANGDSIIY